MEGFLGEDDCFIYAYRGLWKSNSALARRYLAGARPSTHSFMALGEVCHKFKVLHCEVSKNSVYMVNIYIIEKII